MKQTLTFYTTLGQVRADVWNPKKIYTCGINLAGELQIQVFTNDNETAGYIIYANVKTGSKRLERIKTAYISYESSLKYGRKAVTEILPIIKK